MRVGVFESERVRVGEVGDDEEVQLKGESEEGRRIGGGALGMVGGGCFSWWGLRQLHG